MPACGECKKMSKEAFGSHVHQLATELKDKIAEKAARTVKNDADGVQLRAQGLANQDAYEKARENNTDVTYPAPLGPDNGYSYLGERDKKMVDDYKKDYQLDLLTFTAADEDAAKEKLKNGELDWIVEKFDRAKNFPDPNKIAPVVDQLAQLAGDDNMVDIKFDKSKTEAVDVKEGTPTGQGKFGAPEFGFAGAMATSVQGFDSATGKSFRDQFVPRIPIASNNQKGAVRTIRNLLATNEGVYNFAREDIDGLLHDGKTAVEHFDDCKSGDDDMAATLGLIGSVAALVGAIAAIPVTGGLSATAIGFATAGVVSGIAGAGVGAARTLHVEGVNKEKKELSGDTLDQVVEKITKYADDTFGKLDEFNEALGSKGFGRVDSHMSGEKSLFMPPRPLDGFMDSTPGNVRDQLESDTD